MLQAMKKKKKRQTPPDDRCWDRYSVVGALVMRYAITTHQSEEGMDRPASGVN